MKKRERWVQEELDPLTKPSAKCIKLIVPIDPKSPLYEAFKRQVSEAKLEGRTTTLFGDSSAFSEVHLTVESFQTSIDEAVREIARMRLEDFDVEDLVNKTLDRRVEVAVKAEMEKSLSSERLAQMVRSKIEQKVTAEIANGYEVTVDVRVTRKKEYIS